MKNKPVLDNNNKEREARRTSLLSNPQFWSIVVIFVLITLHYYDNLTSFRLFAEPDLPLGITRHTIDRILYLVPIILSSLIFGPKGGKITVLIAFLAMLPRSLLISVEPLSALWETVVITLIGSLAPAGLDRYRQQEIQLEATKERLESTERELFSKVQLSIEQQRQLSVINTFSRMLSQSLEFEQVMSTTVDMVMGVMQVEVVIIFSLDDDGVLGVVSYRGIQEESAVSLDGMRLGEGLSGRVAETGQPLIIEDVSAEPKLCNLPIAVESLKTELCVPLMAHGKIMGTLFVASRMEREFASPDVELLMALGNLVGVAMRNAYLYCDREIAAAQLKSSEKRYRQLFENAHDAIWVQDLTGTITAANTAAAELFGCSLSELVGVDSHQFFLHRDYTVSSAIQEDLLSGKGEVSQEPFRQKITKKDGTEAIIMLTTNLLSSNSHPDGFQFIGRDITKEVRMQENQSFYLQQITKAHEDERLRISRDLHDSTAQNIIAMLRQVEKFSEENTQFSDDKLKFLWSLHAELKETLQEIRELSRDLRPSVLDNLGLLPAVEWLVEQLKNDHSIKATLEVTGKDHRFAPELEITLFRIIQEALRNITKHALASEVKVNIELNDGETMVTICDNGQGFNLPVTTGELSRQGKLGIDGMQTRARLVGGTFSIVTNPGEGTTINVTIPA